MRRSVGGLATILGPLWAGGLIGNLYLMLGMMLALLTMIMVSGQLTGLYMLYMFLLYCLIDTMVTLACHF